jgi:hypothetical protein
MLSVIMLSVITLNVIMLSVIMLCVVMLSVVMLSVVMLNVVMSWRRNYYNKIKVRNIGKYTGLQHWRINYKRKRF